ncbi:MAG: hypothetical protein ACSHX7_02895 [Luteolibacter sp.]
MQQPPAIPPTLSPESKKKGIPAIAWVGIGCGGLLILGIIVAVIGVRMFMGKMQEFTENPEKAAAEMIVKFDPNLDKVSQDDEKGEMTIRTKDGEEMTLSYQDISEGKITMADSEGNMVPYGSGDLSAVPAWVPRAPDLADGVSMYHQVANSMTTGQFSGKTGQSAEELKEFFTEEAENLGMNNSSSSSTQVGGTGTMELEFSGGGKSLVFMVIERGGEPTTVSTSYTEK